MFGLPTPGRICYIGVMKTCSERVTRSTPWAIRAIALALLGCVNSASADTTVVNFTGDYGSSNKPFTSTVLNQTGNFGGGSNDTRSVAPFSDTTPQVIAGGLSGTIYGGYESVNYNAAAGPTYPGYLVRQIENLGTNDALHLGTGARASGSGGRFSGLLMWERADFLNGGSTGTLSLDSNSTITVSRLAGSGTIYDFRVFLCDGNTIYVKNSNYNFAGGTAIESLNTGGQTWAVWDPSVSLSFTGGTFAAHTFTDITGVGFLWNVDSQLNGGTFPQPAEIEITRFAVDLVVTPEPGAGLLLLAGGVALCGRGSRRARALKAA
jgi:hypothetical protein